MAFKVGYNFTEKLKYVTFKQSINANAKQENWKKNLVNDTLSIFKYNSKTHNLSISFVWGLIK